MSKAERPNRDPLGAFVWRAPDSASPPGPEGPLSGLRLAVKDLFDVEGLVTGFGSPAWATEQSPAEATAPAARRLLAAGARLVGKTHLDELAYSLAGANAHYGAPINPAAPDRATGGSSSGSAAAVAGGLAEIGLGSDTGGSVRLPAAYCGLYGLRPSHGRVSLGGARPLAPSFDAAGWFARDADTLGAASAALGLPPAPTPSGLRLAAPVELWALADRAVVAAAADALAPLERRFGPVRPMRLTAEDETLTAWRETFRIVQAAEIWETHGAWIRRARPAFGPGVRERIAAAEALAPVEIAAARAERARLAEALTERLPSGVIAVFPTTPTPAPKRDAPPAALDDLRARSLAMLCPAGIGGLPQLSLPAGAVGGAPIGLSLMAARGADERLLGLAQWISGVDA